MVSLITSIVHSSSLRHDPWSESAFNATEETKGMNIHGDIFSLCFSKSARIG